MFLLVVFFFKQKTAYEMRISDWSSDVCSSDLLILRSKPDGSSRPDHSMLDQGSRVGGAPSHGTVFAVRVVRVGVPAPAIGRALCRERVIQYVLTSEVAVSCTKNCQQI